MKMRWLGILVIALILLPGQVLAVSTGDVNVGEYVQFGSYNGEPILWRVINVNEDGSRMLWSDRILALKGFDPKGNAPGGRANEARLEQGSNYYPESTLRIWLNSDSEEVDYPYNPPKGHPDGFFYPQSYHDMPGFLTGFTAQERDAIVPRTHRVLLGQLDVEVSDGGSQLYQYDPRAGRLVSNSGSAYYKEVTDSVFLLSGPDLQRYVHDRGWSIFKQPTLELVEERPWLVDSGFSVSNNHKYWLNSPFPETGRYSFVMTVGDGSRTYHGGYVGTYHPLDNEIGVVPALNLKSGISIVSGDGTVSNPYVVFQRIPVYLDGVELILDDPPLLRQGRTLAPMRAFFEALGADVTWEPDTRTAVGQRGEITVRIPVDSVYPTINGVEHEIDIPAQIINGRTYIPLRFTGEALGDEVLWNPENRSVEITTRQ